MWCRGGGGRRGGGNGLDGQQSKIIMYANELRAHGVILYIVNIFDNRLSISINFECVCSCIIYLSVF